jgi:tetratricopeptide (TPR) repeat protein
LKLGSSEIQRLLDRTGANPMLLRISAGQLLEPHVNVQAFLEHLETQPQVASYLLGTMLDGLSQSAHWLASFLSVFRQPVDLYDAALMEMVQSATAPGALAHSIAELQSKYLIEDPRRSALHPLVLDFLYASVTSDAPRRKHLHRLAAEWWEGGVGDMVEASYHWLRAGDIEQVAELISVRSEELFQSGHAKAAVDVVDEALERVRLKRGDTTFLRRRLLFARGDLLGGTFRSAEAESSYREALSLAQDLPAVRAEIARNLALILLQRGQSAEALRLCQSARVDLSTADVILLARLGAIESRAHLVLSHYDEAERLANESIALIGHFAEALPNIADDVRARCERTLGWVNYTRHPEGDEALFHYSRALESARRAGLWGIECAILSNFATALLERGKMEEARQSYQQAIEGYRALGNLYGEASVLHNLGALSASMEDYETALTDFNKASEIERLVGDMEGLLSSEGARASLFIAAGKLQEARSVLDRVLIEGRDSNDLWAMGTCLCLSAEVSLLTDELDSARETVKKVLSMPGIESNARIRAWATTDLAMIEVVAGQVSLAHELVAGEPPDDLGFELTTRWRIVQSVAAIGCNDLPRARALAQIVFGEAREKNLKQLIHVAEGLLADPPPSLRGSIRLILLGETA